MVKLETFPALFQKNSSFFYWAAKQQKNYYCAHTTIPTKMIGSESNVHCGTAVQIGQAFPGFLITEHHL